MKKTIFVVLFSLVLFGVYGQQSTENRWILGSWNNTTPTRIDVNGWTDFNNELILNDNGTGRIHTLDIVFSIIGNELYIFNSTGSNIIGSLIIYRITNQRMILSGSLLRQNSVNLNFNKRN